ncbi:MAG: RdgB/HAM1 family non-canonical purine NTP pyrophosphatase [Chromatiales bacterium]|jgi:XTP/dITP diphosphohydrolase|nr:RdgB/HAM1 family non-canonical purine NTP pyrophosphatase [Chromatiales bacterium]MDX9767711.1 RdgB/HAM1 family non-canonical purine NTP pyrophosphatase [Ectothiorhodospiraceae bacterium]
MKIVLATGNRGKVRELSEMLAGSGIQILPQADFGVPEAEETGLTFVENAIIKARNAAAHTGLPAVADDSGIEVDALNGAPGIYSARYAGPGASDADNNARLIAALDGVVEPARTARFRCVMVHLRHAEDPAPLIAEGVWEGQVLTTPYGEGGFGYDPLFFLPAQGCTSAELSAEQKNALSHRGQALRKLVEGLRARGAV